jgi:hypothetical protein
MNTIIVESKNDKAFINALVSHLNISDVNVDSPNISICEDDYVLLNGLDPNPVKPTTLITRLKDIKSDIIKKGTLKIGIILDIDNNSYESRYATVNNAIREAFKDEYSLFFGIRSTTRLYSMYYNSHPLYFGCFFVNVDKAGNLDTLMRSIVNQNSDFADCLESWRTCVESKGHTISQKDFDKFWIANYLRFDTCTKRELKQAERNSNINILDDILKKKPQIFNFDSKNLSDLSDFLKLFNV